jgi:two-component system response regulator RegA
VILVVDDDLSILHLVSRAIENEGHSVSEAATADRALTLAESHEFDLAVLDLRLPDGNGCDLFESLRIMSPRIAGILLTGFATISVAIECGKLGMSQVLQKPIDLRTLIDAVNDTLSTRTALETRPSHSVTLRSVERLAKAIVRVSNDGLDFRTLEEWGRRLGVSRSALRELCYAAAVKPHDALAFARALRALVLGQRLRMPASDLLDFSERRSLTHFMVRAHITSTTSVETFCRQQEFVSKPQLIERILTLWDHERRSTATFIG